MIKSKILPDREFLLQLFQYDRENGLLFWKNVTHLNKRIFIGKLAGRISKSGYRKVSIFDQNYLVHRIIWYIEKGTQPDQLDHINGNRADDRIENLRETTTRLNSQNRKEHRNGKSPGVNYRPKIKKWRAQIHIKGKIVNLGHFETRTAAEDVYKAAVMIITT